jgi:hypothetical protein
VPIGKLGNDNSDEKFPEASVLGYGMGVISMLPLPIVIFRTDAKAGKFEPYITTEEPEFTGVG